jgi:hypothetical protein
MEDTFIGGWAMPAPRHPSPGPAQQPPHTNGDGSAQMNVPPPFLSPHLQQTGYPFVRPPSESASPALQGGGVRASTDGNPDLAQLSPVERSQTFSLRKRIMQPYLQFMCGPLLRYDTVDEHGVWHGAVLIVSKCC